MVNQRGGKARKSAADRGMTVRTSDVLGIEAVELTKATFFRKGVAAKANLGGDVKGTDA